MNNIFKGAVFGPVKLAALIQWKKQDLRQSEKFMLPGLVNGPLIE
jgi:hypothetical protein